MKFQANDNVSFIGLLAGLLAVAVAAYFMYAVRITPVVLIASAFFFCICLTDMLFAKIPNLFNLSLLLAGLGYNLYAAGGRGLLWSLLGTLVGLALFILPYALGGMGAGDVKALAALGALAGPAGIFQIFLYTALFGGFLAILHYCFTHDFRQKLAAAFNSLRAFIYTRDFDAFRPDPQRERQRFPYAAAIALGFFAFVHWGPIVSLLPHS
ncbi:MAG TPA: prepilin peptidase [Desulfuromonadales bacterium]|nr:prepilin peptidase [Desulfuromonadales bacterium]